MSDSQPKALDLGEHVRDLSWTSDSKSVAAGLASGEVVWIDPASRAVGCRWNAHSQAILRLALHPGGRVMVTSGEDGRICWWDVATLGLIRETRDRAWTEHLEWSPDGTLLLAASGKRACLYTPEGVLSQEHGDHPSTISAAVWRGDGKGFATACFGRVLLIRVGESAAYEDLKRKTSHISLALSPNGRHVAAGSQEKTVSYWRLPFRDPEPLQMSGYAQKVRDLAWDRDSRFLATGGGEKVTVWDVSGKGPAASKPIQLAGHPGAITRLAYQRRGEMLASGCEQGSVWLWRPSRGDSGLPAGRLDSGVSALSWSPDEKQLAVGGESGGLWVV